MEKTYSNKQKLIATLRRETDEDHPVGRVKIETLIGNDLDRKTLNSYIRFFSDSEGGCRIKIVSGGPNTAYYYNPSENEFTEEEIRLIIDSVYAVKSVSPEIKKAIKDKLLSVTNKYVAEWYNTADYSVKRKQDECYVSAGDLKKLSAAIKNKASILFDYYQTTPKKEKITRYLDHNTFPQALYINDGYYYLIAYNPLKDAKRHYRVDRMKNVRFGESFKGVPYLEKFNRSEYDETSFGMYQGKMKELTFIAKQNLADQMYDKFNDYRFIKCEGDDFIFTAKAEISPIFYGWLCGYEGNLKILEPKGEAEKYCEYLKKQL